MNEGTVFKFVRQYLTKANPKDHLEWHPDLILYAYLLDENTSEEDYFSTTLRLIKEGKVKYVEVRPLRDFGYYTVKES